MMINYLGSPGRLTLHDDLNYGRKTKLPDAGRALDKTKDVSALKRAELAPQISFPSIFSHRDDCDNNHSPFMHYVNGI